MTRVTTRDVALFAVLLALCTSVAAPASAVAIGDGDSGTTLGDGLESGDSSSSGLTDSSGDDSDDSTDESSSDTNDGSSDDGSTNESSTNGSTDDGSTNESSDESSSDTNDGSTSDSGSLSNWSSNESTADDSNGSDAGTTRSDGDVENRTFAASPTPMDATQNVSIGVLEALEYDILLSLALEESTDTVENASPGGDGSPSPDVTTDVDDETDTVASSLDDRVDALVDGTSGIIVGLSASITGADADGTPPRVDGDRSADTASGASTAAGTGATGAGANAPLPSDSATGVAVGVGALAVAGVVRHGSVVPSGVAGLGSTLAAGLAPVVGRSSALDRLVRTLAPFRYSRYDDSDPLEHEARADVYEVVHGAPGAYLSKVADRADLPLSTARHHIRVLEREDLVSGAKVRGKRRFYPAYTSGIELAAALDDEATAAVIDAVARFGSASVSDLAAELDRDPSTVSHHLSRLAEDGIVVRERDGRAVNNKLSPEARTALEPERETDAAEVGEALASD